MKLLVACDGSKTSLHAVKTAIDLIKGSADSGRITLISVHDNVALQHASRFVGRDVTEDYLREWSEKELTAARRVLNKAGVPHDIIIRRGHVAGEIAAAAKRGKFDMVVLGSKGRSALRDLLIGSVAQRVSELSVIPVLLVK